MHALMIGPCATKCESSGARGGDRGELGQARAKIIRKKRLRAKRKRAAPTYVLAVDFDRRRGWTVAVAVAVGVTIDVDPAAKCPRGPGGRRLSSVNVWHTLSHGAAQQ